MEGLTKEQLVRAIDRNLHVNFRPHSGQVEVLRAFDGGYKRFFVRCGRKWGKSTFACYVGHKRGLFLPYQRIYLLAPLYKQAREIYWESGLLPRFLEIENQASPFVSHVDNQETRITFFNGSFIKVDGSDNFNSQRGWNPDLVVADEYAEFDPRWLDVMIPNLAARNGIIFFIGTPPEELVSSDGKAHPYVQMDEEFQESMKVGRKVFWVHRPSWANDRVFGTPEGREWLEEEKARLVRRGEEDVYRREYGAELVKVGARFAFPMFEAEPLRHVFPHEELWAEVFSSIEDYEFWVIADPGTRKCFAVGFFAVDREACEIIQLDEIYATDQSENSVGVIYPRIEEAIQEFNPLRSAWSFVYDEAAAWFQNEVASHYSDDPWIPTDKSKMRQESNEAKPYLSAIKDGLVEERIKISDRCVRTIAEFRTYKKNAKGIFTKENDHQIDIHRYLQAHLGLSKLKAKRSKPGRVFSLSKSRQLNEALMGEEGFSDLDGMMEAYDIGELI